MLCETCLSIPLDPFLPHEAWGRYRNGRAWWGSAMVRSGSDCLDRLRESSGGDDDAGCQLCTILLGVLEDSEPFWATDEFTGSDHDKLLKAPRTDEVKLPEGLQIGVRVEGEMLVTDGNRTAGLYWELESMKYGRSQLAVRDRADCDENFVLAKNWLDACLQEHDTCRAGIKDAEFLPTRLIHVGDPAERKAPRLILTSDFPFPQTQYFALSHCWGTDRGKTVPKTTTSNMAEQLERIDVESLPKTFLDAMEVVRRLGYRYLWIDSLCIVQDDKNDFEVECSQMHLVYSQALCTIVAADSPNGDGGCFIPRDLRKVKPCVITLKNNHVPYRSTSIMDVIRERLPGQPEEAQVTIYPNFGPWIKGIQGGAVFGRGWCLQEREMSPRVLHYTRQRLMWECRTCTASEEKPEMEAKKQKNESLAPHLSSFRVLDDESLHVTSRLANRMLLRSHKWDKVVEAYSGRRLSVGSDKLPAISGIARFVCERLQPGEKYLAGIWSGNLLKGLSWFPQKSRHSGVVRAEHWPPSAADSGIPSWSWAAHDGPITFVGDSWFSGGWATIIGPDGKEEWVKSGPEVVVKSASVEHDSVDPFGRVSGGEVVLEGWTGELTVSEEHLVSQSDDANLLKKPSFRSKLYKGFEDDIPELRMFFDYDVADLPVTKFLCLQLGTGISLRGGNPKADTGLVLVQVEPGSFRRVGMFDIAGDRAGWHSIRKQQTTRIV